MSTVITLIPTVDSLTIPCTYRPTHTPATERGHQEDPHTLLPQRGVTRRTHTHSCHREGSPGGPTHTPATERSHQEDPHTLLPQRWFTRRTHTHSCHREGTHTHSCHREESPGGPTHTPATERGHQDDSHTFLPQRGVTRKTHTHSSHREESPG